MYFVCCGSVSLIDKIRDNCQNMVLMETRDNIFRNERLTLIDIQNIFAIDILYSIRFGNLIFWKNFTFQSLWPEVGGTIERIRAHPRPFSFPETEIYYVPDVRTGNDATDFLHLQLYIKWQWEKEDKLNRSDKTDRRANEWRTWLDPSTKLKLGVGKWYFPMAICPFI